MTTRVAADQRDGPGTGLAQIRGQITQQRSLTQPLPGEVWAGGGCVAR